MKESSSLSLAISLCLSSSPVRNQLMLTVPSWGYGAPYPQSGVPFPRIHAHSVPMVQNITNVYLFFGAQLQTFTNPLQPTAWTPIQDIVLKELVFLHPVTIKTRTYPEALCNALVLCFVYVERRVCYCTWPFIHTGVSAVVPVPVYVQAISAVPVPVYVQAWVLLHLYLYM